MSADAALGSAKPPEQPEHRNDRRRFLIWACMAGLVKPDRVTEQILQELEQETRDG